MDGRTLADRSSPAAPEVPRRVEVAHSPEPCVGPPSPGPDQPFTALRDLRARWERTATREPLLVTVDDLHLAGRVDVPRRVREEIDGRATSSGSEPVRVTDVRATTPTAPRSGVEADRWGPPLDPTDDPQLVRYALRAGHPDRARRVVATAARRARAHPEDPVLLAAHAHAVGLLTGDLGELMRAVSLLDVERWPFAHASVLEDAGRAVRDRDRAVGMLETAMRTYDRAGAPADAARVRSRLRALGVHRRRAVGRTSGLGWASLTPTEIEVVRLVCRGATNRQAAKELYLSPHTVNSHLRRTFSKLGVGSRVELTRIALAHDDAGASRATT